MQPAADCSVTPELAWTNISETQHPENKISKFMEKKMIFLTDAHNYSNCMTKLRQGACCRQSGDR